MENIRSKMRQEGYLGLTRLGRPAQPPKGLVSEDLGQSEFKAGPSTGRRAFGPSQKPYVATDDMHYDSSDDEIDVLSLKNQSSSQRTPSTKPIRTNEPARKKIQARPVLKAKVASTDEENKSKPSTSRRTGFRPSSNTGKALHMKEDGMLPSGQPVLQSKRPRKTSAHNDGHGTSPLEELSPNRTKRSKTFKSRANQLEPAPFPMQDECHAAKSKKRSPKRSAPEPAPFPMDVPLSRPEPVLRKPRPAPFSCPTPPSPPARSKALASRAGPRRFPLDSPTASRSQVNLDEDDMNIKDKDIILTHGGPRPFPMSMSQFPPKLPNEASGSKRSAYGESSSDEGEQRVNKKSRPSPEPDRFGSLSLDGDDNVDPSTICPYCDEPWPSVPSPTLIALLERTKRKSYSDPRPGNPLGLKAPLAAFIELCQRHRFEMTHLPLALARGWPTHLDFPNLPKRIGAFRKELGRFVGRPHESQFWREVRDDAREVGVMKVVSVSGQYATFERSQPGYYGEQGSIIIHQSLYSLFPPDSISPASVLPLTPDQFLTRVLVPETAALLIQQDMGLPTKEQALRVLEESKKYGLAMFPEQAQNEEVAEVGEQLARERARARRKVLEARGEADADVRREVEKERRQARKAGGKGKEKESSNVKGNRVAEESDPGTEVSQSSEQEQRKKGKRKAKQPVDIPLPGDSVPKASHRRWDDNGDVHMLDDSEEPTPRVAKMASTFRESSATSWRENPASSSPDRPTAFRTYPGSSPLREPSSQALSQQSEGAQDSQWTFKLCDDVDLDEMIANNQRKAMSVSSDDTDSDVLVIEDVETPKPKPKPTPKPRRVVKKAVTVIQSEESASDTDSLPDIVSEKPRKRPKPKPKPKPKDSKVDEVDGGGDVKMKGVLGQTKRRKKGKSVVKGALSGSESGSHSWLLDDSSD